MAVKINPTLVTEGLDAVELIGNLVFSGAYPVGGETLDFTTAIGYQSPNGRVFAPAGPPIAGGGFIAGTGGDSFGFVAGTTLANSKVVINTASATVASGNYGAEITGDTNIGFSVTFPK